MSCENVIARLSFKVFPSAPRNKVGPYQEGIGWKVYIKAQPEHGKANDALIRFLAEVLMIRQVDISIVSGHTTQKKILTFKGVAEEAVQKKLTACMMSNARFPQ